MNIVENDIVLCDLYAPDYIFSMRKYNEDFEWYSFFHQNNIQGVVYAFYYKHHLIRVGCSFAKYQTRSDNNASYCERLIRQIKNLPGGTKGTKYKPDYGMIYESKNGENIIEEIQSLEKELNVQINRNDIYIHAWDITDALPTKYFFHPDDSGNKKRALYFEALMVAQYKKDNNGRLPIGNRKQDPTNWNTAFTKPQISKESADLIDWGV